MLPRHAVPRYYRFVDDLPRTATAKVSVATLRGEGVTDDAVDTGSTSKSVARRGALTPPSGAGR